MKRHLGGTSDLEPIEIRAERKLKVSGHLDEHEMAPLNKYLVVLSSINLNI